MGVNSRGKLQITDAEVSLLLRAHRVFLKISGVNPSALCQSLVFSLSSQHRWTLWRKIWWSTVCGKMPRRPHQNAFLHPRLLHGHSCCNGISCAYLCCWYVCQSESLLTSDVIAAMECCNPWSALEGQLCAQLCSRTRYLLLRDIHYTGFLTMNIRLDLMFMLKDKEKKMTQSIKYD